MLKPALEYFNKEIFVLICVPSVLPQTSLTLSRLAAIYRESFLGLIQNYFLLFSDNHEAVEPFKFDFYYWKFFVDILFEKMDPRERARR